MRTGLQRLAALALPFGLLAYSLYATAESQPTASTDRHGVTLRWMVEHSLANSPTPRISSMGIELAMQQRRKVLAALKPQLSASAIQARQTRNLATIGLDFPGVDPLVGPFSVFDARAQLTQTVIDLAWMSQLRSADAAIAASKAQAELVREQLSARVAAAYIQTLGAQGRVVSAEADSLLAEKLLTLAKSRLDLGLASGVDALRAETAFAQAEYAVTEARTGLSIARLDLQAISQLPFDPQALKLSGKLASGQVSPADTPEAVLASAWRNRADLRLMRSLIEQAEAQLAAAQRKRLPTVTAQADYGLSGNTPTMNQENTYQFGVTLSLPLFTGGALAAEQSARQTELEQQILKLRDLERQVEQEVNKAIVSVTSASELVRAAQSTLALASREVESAREQFAHGVADNLDVISAQAGLARARSQLITAQAARQQARLRLAVAKGNASQFDLESPRHAAGAAPQGTAGR